MITAEELFDQIENGTNVLYKLTGMTGIGKTTLALKIGDLFTQSGKTVQYYQRIPEETIADVISHRLIEDNRKTTGVGSNSPDFVIIDDFPGESQEIYLKLGKMATVHGYKVLVIRQSYRVGMDSVKMRAVL